MNSARVHVFFSKPGIGCDLWEYPVEKGASVETDEKMKKCKKKAHAIILKGKWIPVPKVKSNDGEKDPEQIMLVKVKM